MFELIPERCDDFSSNPYVKSVFGSYGFQVGEKRNAWIDWNGSTEVRIFQRNNLHLNNKQVREFIEKSKTQGSTFLEYRTPYVIFSHKAMHLAVYCWPRFRYLPFLKEAVRNVKQLDGCLDFRKIYMLRKNNKVHVKSFIGACSDLERHSLEEIPIIDEFSSNFFECIQKLEEHVLK